MNIRAALSPKPKAYHRESCVQLGGSGFNICQGTTQVPLAKAVQNHIYSMLFWCDFS